jgi:hypothetical protein
MKPYNPIKVEDKIMSEKVTKEEQNVLDGFTLNNHDEANKDLDTLSFILMGVEKAHKPVVNLKKYINDMEAMENKYNALVKANKRKNDLEYKARFENLNELELWELAEAKGIIMAHVKSYEHKLSKVSDDE